MRITRFSGAVRVRPAREKDMDAIAAIYRETRKASRKVGNPDGMGAMYPPADRDFIQRFEAGEDRYQTIVAVDGQKVVGYARALHRLDRREPQEAHEPGAKQTTLHKLGVLPERQGEGIGKQLVQAVIDKAKALGRTNIRITLPDGNPMAFYESLGFTKTAELPSPGGNKRPLHLIDLMV